MMSTQGHIPTAASAAAVDTIRAMGASIVSRAGARGRNGRAKPSPWYVDGVRATPAQARKINSLSVVRGSIGAMVIEVAPDSWRADYE